MKKLKVKCPNHEAHTYGKILFVMREDQKRFYFHCSDCKRWIRVDITRGSGVVTEVLPKGYHLDLEELPVLELVKECGCGKS